MLGGGVQGDVRERAEDDLTPAQKARSAVVDGYDRALRVQGLAAEERLRLRRCRARAALAERAAREAVGRPGGVLRLLPGR